MFYIESEFSIPRLPRPWDAAAEHERMSKWKNIAWMLNVVIVLGVCTMIFFFLHSYRTFKRQSDLYLEAHEVLVRDQLLPQIAHTTAHVLDERLLAVNESVGWSAHALIPILARWTDEAVKEPLGVPRFVHHKDLNLVLYESPKSTPPRRLDPRDLEIISSTFHIFTARQSMAVACYLIGPFGLVYYPYRDLSRVAQASWEPTNLQIYRMTGPEQNPKWAIRWHSPYVDRVYGGWMVTMTAPMYDAQKRFLGILGLDIPLEMFTELMKNPEILATKGLLMLYDADGNLMNAWPDKAFQAYWKKPYPGPKRTPPKDLESWKQYSWSRLFPEIPPLGGETRRPRVRQITRNGQTYWFSSVALQTTPWTLALVYPRSAFVPPSFDLGKYGAPLMFASLILAGLIILYLAGIVWSKHEIDHTIVRPLGDLSRSLETQDAVPPIPRAIAPIRRVAEALEAYQARLHEQYEQARRTGWRLKTLVETLQEAYACLDSEGRVLEINPAFEKLFHVTAEEVRGRPFVKLFLPASQSRLLPMLAHWRTQPDQWESGLTLYHGAVRYLRFSTTPLGGSEAGKEIALFISDWTGLHNFATRLETMQTYDAATGLLSRRVFLRQLNHHLNAARRTRSPLSLAILSLDYYPELHTRYGVDVVDHIFSYLHQHLPHPPSSIWARYGEAEIAVLVPYSTPDSVVEWSEEARRRVEQTTIPTHVSRPTPPHVTVTIGVAHYPDHGDVPEDLLRAVHTVILQARRQGGNRVMVFQPQVVASTSPTPIIHQPLELVQAIQENRLVPCFQPIFELASMTLLGYEVLARIRHTQGHLLPAKTFIHNLEQLPPDDQLEFDQNIWLHALATLAERDDRNCYVFINLAQAFLNNPRAFQEILDRLLELENTAERIVFEITERNIIRDPAAFKYIAEAAHRAGFQFAIDDFGSGYTSFQYLRLLPIDFIKIDGSYIQNIHLSLDQQRFVESFLGLMNHLGIQVIAEQIEQEEELETLKGMGVRYGQGFHLGRPRFLDESPGPPP